MIYWRNLVLVCVGLLTFTAEAFAERGFIQLGKGGPTYVDYKPAKEGKPTLVLLNGLTYSLKDWDRYVAALTKLDSGIGILRFDMIGMGETLLKGQLPVNFEISYLDQVERTKQVIDHFHLRKVHLAGLSYGGGLAVAFGARHPEYVSSLILMAPFTEPLKKMEDWINGQVSMTRITFPFNPASDEELYNFFLRQFIYSVYPMLEPVVLENPFKLEAIFRMVQGIRKYITLKDTKYLPDNSVHLLVAGQDQYIERPVLDRFWSAVPKRARASRVDINFTEHKIPEAIPAYAAAWSLEILRERAELQIGDEFTGNTNEFNAKSRKASIDLERK